MNNSKIVSSKTTSAIFLAIVLVTGTFVLSIPSLSMTANVQAQPYYEMDNNNYKKSKDSSSKSINVNKLKCINTNLNINGNNTGDISIGNKNGVEPTDAEEGYSSAYSSGGSSGGYNGEGYYDNDGYSKQDKGFDCIINNNNNNTNISVGGGNQTIPGNQTEPEPSIAQLTVTKITNCDLGQDTCTSVPNAQITVTGNNPNPSSFEAFVTSIDVTLGAGPYSVNEEGFTAGLEECTASGYQGGQFLFDNIYMCTNFSIDCAGDILAGQELACNIENTVIDITPTTGQLTVTKTCFTVPAVDCPDPLITVTGNNPDPNQFGAAQTPIVVTLDAGQYDVDEQGFIAGLEPCNSLGFEGGQNIGGNNFICTNFSEDCAGDIIAGEELSCNISNTIVVATEICDNGIDDDGDGSIDSEDQDCAAGGIAPFDVPSGGTADSPTMAQETQLTASEKITKLKQQWLDLLP